MIKSFNEFSNLILYRGGLPLELEKIKSDGISFSKKIEIAEYWASGNKEGKLFSYILLDKANILSVDNYPEKIIPKEKPYNHQDKERIVNHALVKGYDGVDLSKYFNESEIRIFNLDVIKKL